MWVDVAGGQMQIAISSYQLFATVQPPGVKAVGVTGSYRTPKLPNVPTPRQQGIEGRLVTLEGGLPLRAPAGTPEAVLRALSQVVVDGANTPKAAQLRETFDIPNKPKNLKDTRDDWARNVPVWIKLAVDLGIKPGRIARESRNCYTHGLFWNSRERFVFAAKPTIGRDFIEYSSEEFHVKHYVLGTF